MEEIKNRGWLYLVESVIKLVEQDQSHLKPLPKAERKIIKSMKYNYRSLEECMRQRTLIWQNNLKFIQIPYRLMKQMTLKMILEQIETLYFLFPERKVRPNYFILLKCFTISTGFPIGTSFVPDGVTPPGIIGQKLSLKELFAKNFRTSSNGLLSSPFLAALPLFFAGK